MDSVVRLINMRPKNLNSFLVGSILFILFLVVSLAESQRILNSIDVEITKFLQTFIPRQLDLPLSLFSLAGAIEITMVTLAILFCLIYRKDRVILFSLGFFVVMMIIEIAEKILIFHPGPPHVFFRYSLPFSTPAYIGSHYSFPSGHISRTMFLSIVSLFLFSRWLQTKTLRSICNVLIWIFMVLMVVSRIYLGEHWSSDVLGGLLLGGAMGMFAMVYY